jgi:hypothetical protein
MSIYSNPRSIVHTKLLVLIGVVLTPAMTVPASGICFDTTLLASYEPSEEPNLIVWSPDHGVTVTWPVKGDVNGVPSATEGNYVLKIDFADETDLKIQVRHDWTGFTFDLAGADFIHADIYIATESAMPEIMGLWDNDWPDPFKWISADCPPIRTNEWRTISFGVSALTDVDLDHIEALVFEQLKGLSGTIYVDNLRIGIGAEEINCTRKIVFSEYTWTVLQCDWKCGAGPNYFTDKPEDVWIDPNGYLHLSIVERDYNWYCSEVVANESLGYGTYVFTVQGRPELQDPNIVLGLFVYDLPDYSYVPEKHREIDVEVSRWDNSSNPNNCQYVVQPWSTPGNMYRFYIDEHRTTTYVFTWDADEVCFQSYYGDFSFCPLPEDIIESWCYTGDDIPEPGCENPRINFYLTWGAPPQNGQDAEVVIKSFRYFANIEADIDIDPDTLNLASRGKWITCYIRLPDGYNVADINPDTVQLEGHIEAVRVRFNEEEQFAMAKFDRSELQSILEPGEVELTVTGQLTNGTIFKGTDSIKVIDRTRRGWRGRRKR